MDDAVRWLTDHYRELSWKQIEGLSRSMQRFGLFHLGFFDFYGHMLLKGIDREQVLPKLSGDERTLEFKIRFPVKGAKPGNRIMITKERKGDEPPDVELGVVESDGTIAVHPDFLRGSKFVKDKDRYDEPTTIFYDFTNEENFYGVLRDLGYKVD